MAPKEGCCPCQCGEGAGACPSSGNPEVSLDAMEAVGWAAGLCIPQLTAQRHSYSSQLACCDGVASDFNLGAGYNWVTDPYAGVCDGVVTVVLGACQTYTFDPDGGSYTARYGAKQTLTVNLDGTLRFADTDGTTMDFNDPSGGSAAPGQLKRYTTPGGDTIEVTSYAAGRIAEAVRSTTTGGTTTTDSYLYGLVGAGVNAGLRASCTVRRTTNGGSTWTEIRRVAYDYYTGEVSEFGNAGDLKTMAEQVPDGAGGWVTLRTHYFRYYRPGEAGGFVHGLKFVVGPEAFVRIPAPYTAPDATVALYADHRFEYDASRRVIQSSARGGLLTYGVAYATNTAADDYNNWKRKATFTNPDGSLRIVYTNFIAQELIRELRESSGSSNKWIEAWTYGTSADGKPGLLLQHASPSVVIGYVDNGGAGGDELVVTLRSSDGLIRVYDYYTSTTATPTTPGGALGYLRYAQLKKGSSGTLVRLSQVTYFSRTAGGLTVYPVAESTVYRNDDTTGDITTTYAYTWQSGPDTVQMKTRTTTLPAVTTAQNGPNSSDVRRELFDVYGHMTAVQDQRGYITTYQFDVAKGNMIQTVQDDDAPSGSGWTANGGTRLKLTSDYEADAMGRTTQTLGPVHDAVVNGSNTSLRTASWTVYDEVSDRTLSGQGYATGTAPSYTYTLVDPVTIAWTDQDGRTTQTVVSKRTTGSGRLSASDTFAQADWSRWTASDYDDQSRLASSRVYFLIPATGQGAEGTHYDQTTYGYDVMARQNKVRSPGGTITRTVFDVRSLAIAVWVGTNDAGATDDDPSGDGDPCNNMVQVSASVYDGGSAGGDGNLTQTTLYAAASDTRVTSYGYDYRNRRTSEDGEVDVYVQYTFDNLDRVTRTDRKDTTSGGNLISRNDTAFDDRGRVYLATTYAVDPSTGTVGNSLTGNTWYDPVGNVIKSINAGAGQYVFTKSAFDPVNRQIASYSGWGTSTSYASASSVTGDTVVGQVETTYDDASNVLFTASYQRLNDATGTGALSEGTQPKARISYLANWFDGVGRAIASANYGALTGGFTRPSTPPSRSDTVLVASVDYNAAGEAFSQVDPKGIESRQTWDNANRLVQRVDDYGGLNQTTQWAYTPDGQTATLTAKNPSTGDQVTTYTYGTTLSDSAIARSDLLRKVAYPDSTGDSDTVKYEYNRLGQVTKQTDQRGVVRQFDFDKLGRPTQDRVTTFTTGVDDAVKRIGRAYEVRGMLQTVTSYDNATVGSGAAVNQVKLEYNAFGQVTKDAQDHSTTVSGSTPNVQYAYASGASSSNQIRQTTQTYPDGLAIAYDYGTANATNDRLSRIEAIKNGSTTLAGYTYLGAGAIVRVEYPQPGVRLDLWGGTSGTFAGLDRFGRVIDQRWQNNIGSTPADIDRYQYGYDRNSNRQYRANVVGTAAVGNLDEYYTYDNLNRLVLMQRGTLTGSPPSGISGTPAAQQDWTLDLTGNWNGFVTRASGSTTLNQSRTSNPVNEITGISESTGPAWIDPAYDAAGNMTAGPKAGAETTRLHFVFDAWNRMVTVKNDAGGSPGTTLASYVYDGMNRRIEKTVGGHTYHGYYNIAWQYLETRVDAATTPSGQIVWDLRYIDSPLVLLGGADPLYYTNDANFNVTSLVNGSTGAVAERSQFDPYGQPRFYTAAWATASSSAAGNPVLYAGYTFDAESGMYNVRNRQNYNPSLGRWGQRDPSRHFPNLYEYVLGMPTTSTDPEGLQGKPVGSVKPVATPVQSLRVKHNAITLGTCGEFLWVVRFVLSLPSTPKTGGWIVQQLTVTLNNTDNPDCVRRKRGEQMCDEKQPFILDYWEAFRVGPNRNESATMDHFRFPGCGPCSKGTVTFVGVVEYHDNVDETSLPAAFVPRNPRLGKYMDWPGGLPTSPAMEWEPFGTPSNSVQHEIVISWDCFRGRGGRTVIERSNPTASA